MKNRNLFFSLVVFSMFFASGVFAKSLEADVSTNKLAMGDSLVLNIEYRGNANDKGEPDFSLLNQDFETYSVQRSFKTNIINGTVESGKSWKVLLSPVVKGKLQIPSFEVNGVKSAPIAIEVLAQGSNIKIDKSPDYFMETKIDKYNPYVQEEIILTLNLIEKVGLASDGLSYDDSDDWKIEVLSEPKVSSKRIKGERYRDIEYKFAIFPQRSGKLTTPKIVFRAEYLVESDEIKKGDPFFDVFDSFGFGNGRSIHKFPDMMADRRIVNLEADIKEIEVKEIADGYDDNWWLPAKNVDIYEVWNPKDKKFVTGEAVSRNIVIKAEGVHSSALPDVDFGDVKYMKQYPENPEVDNITSGSGIVAIKSVNNVYIPNDYGKTKISAIEIKWWDVDEDKMKVARVDSQKIRIVKGDVENFEKEVRNGIEVEELENLAPYVEDKIDEDKFEIDNYIIFIVFVFGLLGGLFVAKIFGNKKSYQDVEYKDMKNLDDKIRQACKSNDVKMVENFLTLWMQKNYKGVKNLEDLAKKLKDEDFSFSILEINNIIYGKDDKEWDGKEFYQTFKNISKFKNSKKKSKKDKIDDLY